MTLVYLDIIRLFSAINQNGGQELFFNYWKNFKFPNLIYILLKYYEKMLNECETECMMVREDFTVKKTQIINRGWLSQKSGWA